MSPISPDARASLAPTGTLRVGINYGNVILAEKDAATGELKGVHVDLARALAREAGVSLALAGFPAAGELVAGLKSGTLDVALLSFEIARTGDVVFSPGYLEVDATYLVPPGSPLRHAQEVDREGMRVAIAGRSVYEFYLKRTLKHAKLTSAASTHAAYELFARGKFDALVGLRPRLVADAAMMPGSRVLDGNFMRVEQSIASPLGRPAAAQYVRDFAEDAKASGLVAQLLEQHNVVGVAVSPPSR